MEKFHLQYYFSLDDLNSIIRTIMIPYHAFILQSLSELGEFYVGNSYCIAVDHSRSRPWLAAAKLATGESVAKWIISDELYHPPFIVAHSNNVLVAIITQRPASVRFLKIVVPE